MQDKMAASMARVSGRAVQLTSHAKDENRRVMRVAAEGGRKAVELGSQAEGFAAARQAAEGLKRATTDELVIAIEDAHEESRTMAEEMGAS